MIRNSKTIFGCFLISLLRASNIGLALQLPFSGITDVKFTELPEDYSILLKTPQTKLIVRSSITIHSLRQIIRRGSSLSGGPELLIVTDCAGCTINFYGDEEDYYFTEEAVYYLSAERNKLYYFADPWFTFDSQQQTVSFRRALQTNHDLDFPLNRLLNEETSNYVLQQQPYGFGIADSFAILAAEARPLKLGKITNLFIALEQQALFQLTSCTKNSCLFKTLFHLTTSNQDTTNVELDLRQSQLIDSMQVDKFAELMTDRNLLVMQVDMQQEKTVTLLIDSNLGAVRFAGPSLKISSSKGPIDKTKPAQQIYFAGNKLVFTGVELQGQQDVRLRIYHSGVDNEETTAARELVFRAEGNYLVSYHGSLQQFSSDPNLALFAAKNIPSSASLKIDNLRLNYSHLTSEETSTQIKFRNRLEVKRLKVVLDQDLAARGILQVYLTGSVTQPGMKVDPVLKRNFELLSLNIFKPLTPKMELSADNRHNLALNTRFTLLVQTSTQARLELPDTVPSWFFSEQRGYYLVNSADLSSLSTSGNELWVENYPWFTLTEQESEVSKTYSLAFLRPIYYLAPVPAGENYAGFVQQFQSDLAQLKIALLSQETVSYQLDFASRVEPVFAHLSAADLLSEEFKISDLTNLLIQLAKNTKTETSDLLCKENDCFFTTILQVDQQLTATSSLLHELILDGFIPTNEADHLLLKTLMADRTLLNFSQTRQLNDEQPLVVFVKNAYGKVKITAPYLKLKSENFAGSLEIIASQLILDASTFNSNYASRQLQEVSWTIQSIADAEQPTSLQVGRGRYRITINGEELTDVQIGDSLTENDKAYVEITHDLTVDNLDLLEASSLHLSGQLTINHHFHVSEDAALYFKIASKTNYGQIKLAVSPTSFKLDFANLHVEFEDETELESQIGEDEQLVLIYVTGENSNLRSTRDSYKKISNFLELGLDTQNRLVIYRGAVAEDSSLATEEPSAELPESKPKETKKPDLKKQPKIPNKIEQEQEELLKSENTPVVSSKEATRLTAVKIRELVPDGLILEELRTNLISSYLTNDDPTFLSYAAALHKGRRQANTNKRIGKYLHQPSQFMTGVELVINHYSKGITATSQNLHASFKWLTKSTKLNLSISYSQFQRQQKIFRTVASFGRFTYEIHPAMKVNLHAGGGAILHSKQSKGLLSGGVEMNYTLRKLSVYHHHLLALTLAGNFYFDNSMIVENSNTRHLFFHLEAGKSLGFFYKDLISGTSIEFASYLKVGYDGDASQVSGQLQLSRFFFKTGFDLSFNYNELLCIKFKYLQQTSEILTKQSFGLAFNIII